MPEGVEGSESFRLKTNHEVQILPENDRAIDVLRSIESGYQRRHLVTGSLGAEGVVGREFRSVHDIDMCIPRQDAAVTIDFFAQLGFTQLPPEQARHLHGNGAILKRPDGFSVDVWFGDFSEQGLTLRSPDGELFIPREGLDYAANLRGVEFKTLSPEVHYFLKNRAISRHPLRTISPVNRSQDVTDYKELKKVVDPIKAKYLLSHGFAYRGRHPLPRIIKEQIGDKIKKVLNPRRNS